MNVSKSIISMDLQKVEQKYLANMLKIKDRKDVVQLIKQQMDTSEQLFKQKHGCHHYGYVELRDLLDFIYGEPPKNKEEEL